MKIKKTKAFERDFNSLNDKIGKSMILVAIMALQGGSSRLNIKPIVSKKEKFSEIIVKYHRHSRWLEEAPLKGAIKFELRLN
ncbi:hypothetical protein FACS1894109_13110 [Spirochaetia bacterium]|nr:hypothetical protein FACS1894109_13110 [Spirochaetia bacterium]